MKLNYYGDTDSLYIELSLSPSVDTREIAAGIQVDFDAKGDVVGIDIDHASKKLDLKSLETQSLPLQSAKIA